jgi:hypothetical protein
VKENAVIRQDGKKNRAEQTQKEKRMMRNCETGVLTTQKRLKPVMGMMIY